MHTCASDIYVQHTPRLRRRPEPRGPRRRAPPKCAALRRARARGAVLG